MGGEMVTLTQLALQVSQIFISHGPVGNGYADLGVFHL